MMKDDQVVVVDFKFGKENPKYNKQVKGYMQLLTKMGYKNITGYLWYVDEEKIEKVSAKNKDENTNTLHLYRYLCNTFSKGLVFCM